MPITVLASFDAFFDKINLSGDFRETANGRVENVVKHLKKRFEVLDAFATGSIPRFTALKKESDVDVVVVLHYGKHLKDKLPSAILQEVRDSLKDFKTNVRKNGQAVTLYYDTWPNVDIVPAAVIRIEGGAVDDYDIPDSTREQWVRSRPKIHSKRIEAKSSECGPLFRQIVKMAKAWNRAHGSYMQSYHLEVIALNAFSGTLSSLPWDVFWFFSRAADLTATPLWYEGSYVDAYLSSSDRAETVKRLASARDTARDAWYSTYGTNNDQKKGIEKWKAVFGADFPAYG